MKKVSSSPVVKGKKEGGASRESDAGSMARTSRKLRYLALGDSYTIGEGVNTDEAFPFQAARVESTPLRPLSDFVECAKRAPFFAVVKGQGCFQLVFSAHRPSLQLFAFDVSFTR